MQPKLIFKNLVSKSLGNPSHKFCEPLKAFSVIRLFSPRWTCVQCFSLVYNAGPIFQNLSSLWISCNKLFCLYCENSLHLCLFKARFCEEPGDRSALLKTQRADIPSCLPESQHREQVWVDQTQQAQLAIDWGSVTSAEYVYTFVHIQIHMYTFIRMFTSS